MWAVFGQKQPFLALNGPKTHSKQPSKGKRLVHSTTSLILSYKRALCCPLTPWYVRETPQKAPKRPKTGTLLTANGPKLRPGRILGYMAQNVIARARS